MGQKGRWERLGRNVIWRESGQKFSQTNKKHQEGQGTTNRIDSKKTKPTYVIVNVLESKYKEKILKAATPRLIVGLSTENKAIICFQCWKKITATLELQMKAI